MKKVAILVATIAFTVSINTKVFATGVENSVTTSPNIDTNISEVVNKDTGIMPDSMFYFIDKAFDNLKIFLTFDDAKKAEIISQVANERIAEYDSMTEKEKYDLSQKIIKALDKLSEKLDVLEEESDNEVNIEHKEALSNMLEKRHQLNTARREYQSLKVDLNHAEKSGDELAMKDAQELLKVKEDLYKDAKESFKIAFEEIKAVKKDTVKSDDKIEEAKVIEDEKIEKEKVVTEEKIEKEKVEETKEVKEIKEVKEAKVAKEIKEVKSEVKENIIRNENKREEIKEKLENIEIRNDNKKEKTKEKTNEIKENIKR